MSKRGNGEGSIYAVYEKDENGNVIKDKNGKEKVKYWIGQFTAGRKADGKINRKSVYGSTRKEVKEKMTKALADVQSKSFIEKNTITLLEVIDIYLEQLYNSNTIKDVTYKRHLDTRRIIETLDIANQSIQNITILSINNSLASISNYSNSIIEKVYGLINQAFNLALLNKLISSNPFSIKGAILKPKSIKDTKKIDALTIEEQNMFIKQLNKSEDNYKDVFFIALYTGMRIGEILALKKEDINISEQKININKTLTKDKNDKVILGKTTKTYVGTREIPFLSILIPVLQKYTLDGFLFLNGENFINPSTINTHFKKICKDANIKVITIKKNKKNSIVNLKTSNVNTHMLRHTFATRCIEAGMSAVVLQKILGHKDIETTLNTYTSVFNQFKEDELSKAEQYFKKINSQFNI